MIHTCEGEFEFFDIEIKASGQIKRAEKMPNGIFYVYKGTKYSVPAVDEQYRSDEINVVRRSAVQKP